MDYKEISNEKYHSLKEISSSNIRDILENIRRWRYKKEWKSSKSMKMGTRVHSGLLEPQSVKDEYVITNMKIPKKIKNITDNINVKLYPTSVLTLSGALSKSKKAIEIINNLDKDIIFLLKEEMEEYLFYKKNKDKIFITDKENEVAEKAIKKVKDKYPLIFDFTLNEKSIFSKINNLGVKIRPDSFKFINEDTVQIIDLKVTGKEATRKEFEKSVRDYNLHIQQAFYELVFESLDIEVKSFKFLLVSTLDYSGVEMFIIARDLIEDGKRACFKAIEKLKYCTIKEEWEEGDFIDGQGFVKETIIDLPYLYGRFDIFE